jgi:hypothetical protein
LEPPRTRAAQIAASIAFHVGDSPDSREVFSQRQHDRPGGFGCALTFPFQHLSLESVVTSCLCSPWSSPILSLVTLKFVPWIAVVVLPNEKGGPLARSALTVIELNNYDRTCSLRKSGWALT